MPENKDINHLKRQFNYSIFFSTEVSMATPSPKQTSRYSDQICSISEKIQGDPHHKLANIRKKTKQVVSQLENALKNKIRAQNAYERSHKDAENLRHQFLKLYALKKFKIYENDIIHEGKIKAEESFRVSCEKNKKKKLYNQLSHMIMKNQQLDHIDKLIKKHQDQKQAFRETFRSTNQRIYEKTCENFHKIKKGKTQFLIRKKNINDLNATRSKFNYMVKINSELEAIKQYQDFLDSLKKMGSSKSQEKQLQEFKQIFTMTSSKMNRSRNRQQ